MEPEEVLEQEEVVEEPTNSEMENVEESAVETPTEPVAEPEPMTVATNGDWMRLENIMTKDFEVGKTYHIKVRGNCEFMVSGTKPTMGIKSNEITFTKEPGMDLWIKTGV